jgi:hypothetical protein
MRKTLWPFLRNRSDQPSRPVGGGHPSHPGLAVAVEEHHRQAGFIGRDLIKDIGVVHMSGLPGSGVLPLVLRVKGSLRGDGDAPGGEKALFPDAENAVLLRLGNLRCGGRL